MRRTAGQHWPHSLLPGGRRSSCSEDALDVAVPSEMQVGYFHFFCYWTSLLNATNKGLFSNLNCSKYIVAAKHVVNMSIESDFWIFMFDKRN